MWKGEEVWNQVGEYHQNSAAPDELPFIRTGPQLKTNETHFLPGVIPVYNVSNAE